MLITWLIYSACSFPAAWPWHVRKISVIEWPETFNSSTCRIVLQWNQIRDHLNYPMFCVFINNSSENKYSFWCIRISMCRFECELSMHVHTTHHATAPSDADFQSTLAQKNKCPFWRRKQLASIFLSNLNSWIVKVFTSIYRARKCFPRPWCTCTLF